MGRAVEAYLEEVAALTSQPQYGSKAFLQGPAALRLLGGEVEDRSRLLLETLKLLPAKPSEGGSYGPAIRWDGWSSETVRNEALVHLVRRLLQSSLRLPADEGLEGVEPLLSELRARNLPLAPVVRALAASLRSTQAELPDRLRGLLGTIAKERRDGNAEERRLAENVDRLLASEVRPFLVTDPLGRRLQLWVDQAGSLETGTCRADRVALLEQAALASGKSQPAQRWYKAMAERVCQVPGFVPQVREWAETYDLSMEKPPCWENGARIVLPAVEGRNADLMKGLLWGAAAVGGEELAVAVGSFAERCFKKIPDHGPASKMLGNAAIVALELMPERQGVAELTRLAGKIRYPSARTLLDKALQRMAKREGLSPAALEEMAVSTCGLDTDGTFRAPMGDAVAEIRIVGSAAVELRWHQPTGRVVKSVPKVVQESLPEEVKALHRRLKEIRATLAGQSGRIERLYLARHDWSYEEWWQRYAAHPLLSQLAGRLIWSFGGAQPVTGLYRDGKVEGVDGAELALKKETRVRLWHPQDAPAREVLAWRERLEELEITQPFKQVHREIYVLTDAERATGTYSNRFAAHVLRQHQFLALCQQRSWAYQLQGTWDSHNTPHRKLPAWDLTVELWVDGVEEAGDGTTGFSYVTTDQVRFVRDGEPIPLEEVPTRVFSEAMRDVDLFAAVTSLGNDPNWEDRGDQPGLDAYWQSFSFGELSATARTRREVLERVLPKLSIADQCALEERFLRVQGRLRTYRIHLGSSNIQMEPNQQYLCIVPGRRSEAPKVSRGRLYLPFEGDRTLSLILSKAFLLAADDKVDDPAIVSQIRS